MQFKPAIVIAAYNRPHTLMRLLQSVANAQYEVADIPLVISIDKSDSAEVAAISHNFNWLHGPKHVIEQPVNLGLKKHIISCCQLSQQYGSIIMLEDDLLVSPHFYTYAVTALHQYHTDDIIAGISLYSYAIAENGFVPFYPYSDGYCNYFMQLPSSWGQAYTATQWKKFEEWYTANPNSNEDILPTYVRPWGDKSWKKHFVQYIIETAKYFVYPKIAYSSNSGEPGSHTDRTGLYQVQLANAKPNGSFSTLQQSVAVYDAWFEMLPDKLSIIAPTLNAYNYTVDLYGTKELESIDTPYLLSSKPCNQTLVTFGNAMPEVAENIRMDVEGEFFSLGLTNTFSKKEFDPLPYYINLDPIKEIVVDKYIRNKFQQYLDEQAYKQKFPFVTIVLMNVRNDVAKEITNHISQSISYPKDRYTVKQLSKQQPLNSISYGTEHSYYMLLEDNSPFDLNVISEAIAIMQKYSDVNWLTFTCEQSSTLQRWNKHLYMQSLAANSNRRIHNGYTVFSNTALMAIGNLTYESVAQVWLQLFNTQHLYTCISLNVNAPVTAYSPLETNLANRFWESQTLKNINYLRAYYKNKQGLTPLIRYEASSKAYYLSDY